jgi:hypothetical protein
VAVVDTGAFLCASGRDMALDEATRVRLGAQSATAPDVLEGLAKDPSVTVRAALALNPATTAETNASLAHDADDRVRALLARKLGVLVPALSTAALARLRQQTLETLTLLARDETVRVRAAIADAVKDLPDAPRELILRLANDTSVSVCDPVIRFSPLLTSDDLVALVAAAPSPGTRLAVARRPAIDAAVSEAIAAGGTDDVILALLLNGSAQIREATLDALVERSISHADWHAPLVARPVLSAQSVRTLSCIVADQLLGRLAARADLDAGLAAELRSRVAARLEPDPMREPTVSPKDKPGEEDLLEAARDGDAWKAAVMLAAAAEVPLPIVRRAATLRSAKGVVSLVWKAGFSMKAAHALQLLLARLSPGTALRPGPGGSFPLSVQEMRWQLDFLAGHD